MADMRPSRRRTRCPTACRRLLSRSPMSRSRRSLLISARRGAITARLSVKRKSTRCAQLHFIEDVMTDSEQEDAAVDEIVRDGPHGAIAVAGIATAIVIGLWFAFYFLVFLPRGVIQ